MDRGSEECTKKLSATTEQRPYHIMDVTCPVTGDLTIVRLAVVYVVLYSHSRKIGLKLVTHKQKEGEIKW